MTLRLRSARPTDLRVILAELGKLGAVADPPASHSSAADAQPLIAGDVAKAAYRVLTKIRCLNDADRIAHIHRRIFRLRESERVPRRQVRASSPE
jgi:hypothetical protein